MILKNENLDLIHSLFKYICRASLMQHTHPVGPSDGIDQLSLGKETRLLQWESNCRTSQQPDECGTRPFLKAVIKPRLAAPKMHRALSAFISKEAPLAPDDKPSPSKKV